MPRLPKTIATAVIETQLSGSAWSPRAAAASITSGPGAEASACHAGLR